MITVIIPVFNGERYIESLIDNFECQSGAFKLLFINDGSTDGTQALLEQKKKTSSIDIEVLSQENRGVSAARNTGILAADTEYITFCDVDDAVRNNYMSVLLNTLMDMSMDVDALVFESTRVMENNVDQIINEETKKYINTPNAEELSSLEMLERLLINPTRYGVYNLVVRREILINKDILFAENYKYYEDYEFLYKVFSVVENILCLDIEMYFYIQRSGSVMNRFTWDRVSDLSLLYELIPWFNKYRPRFNEKFSKWGVSRVYWSVLWQAAVAFDKSDFQTFVKKTDATIQINELLDFPVPKVRISSKLFSISETFYYILMSRLGAKKTKIKSVSLQELLS